jgi:ABC-type antimicrobial peptide transport system permease subunit
MVGEYDSMDGIVAALDKIKKTGYKLYEVYSPFPTGIAEKSVILSKTYSGWYAFIGGLIGLALGLFIVWYMNGVSYPLNVSGKPLFNIFLAAPVAFEISILFAAIGAVTGMFGNRPNFSNPLFKSERFSTSCSRDKYYVSVDSSDEKYLLDRTRDMFISTGASNIELIEK